MPDIRKIVSGGQTGVDRAALDLAIELQIPHGGWLPLNRMTEDGPLPDHYNLEALTNDDHKFSGIPVDNYAASYRERTKRNVNLGTATVVIIPNRTVLTPGTRLTIKTAKRLRKYCFVVSLDEPYPNLQLARYLNTLDGSITLNVAGPRESSYPSIYGAAKNLLRSSIGILYP